jgi:hypothetical protein
VWQWRIWGTGAIQVSFTGSFDVTQPGTGWPYPFGYCSVDDVQSRINAGTWDATAPTASPNQSQINDFIMQASALIDGRLLLNGFSVPLRVIPGFVGGAIMPQAWILLRSIAAQYATAWTEDSRHGSTDENVDAHTKALFTAADDLLCQIGGWGSRAEADKTPASKLGNINLTLFGVAGPFPLVADKSLGIRASGQPGWVAQATRNPFLDALRGDNLI